MLNAKFLCIYNLFQDKFSFDFSDRSSTMEEEPDLHVLKEGENESSDSSCMDNEDNSFAIGH